MFIQKILEKKYNDNNRVYMAADFETILINNVHYVYMIGEAYLQHNKLIKDKKIFKYSNINLNDESNVIDNSYKLIENFIRGIINKNNDTTKIIVYFHNLGNFDCYFIVKSVNKIKKVIKKNIIIRDNKIYKITLNNIVFLDSINMVNESLNDIGKTFLNDSKDNFDISKIKSLKDIRDNFNEINNYLRKDVYLLYDFIIMWKNKINSMFNIDIVKNFTISSISFAIYRRNYLKDYQEIEITKGYKYEFIKKSYYGGITNVFRASLNEGFCYDVNSLYPYIMKSVPMPMGKGKYIYSKEASIKDFNKYYGFCECLIKIPENLPIPPLIHKKDNTILMPIGIIKGVWHTDEINFALEKGCEILKIYKIINYKKKEIIFKDFVEDMYNKRLKSESSIENKIYKLIMNSLYGRFGMDIEKSNTIWDLDEVNMWCLEQYSEVSRQIDYTNDDVLENNNLFNYKINLEKYNELISNENISENDKNMIIKSYNKFKNNYQSISSIQIASTITAQARIYMLKVMYDVINKGGKIYYTDTDSIFTDKELSIEYVSDNEIGKFKKEYDIKKAIFLASKVYCCVKHNNEEICKFKGLKKISEKNLSYQLYKSKLQYNSYYEVKDIERNFVKDYRKMTINKSVVNMNFTFNTMKYEKVYIEGQFSHTKPIFINELDIEDIFSNEINLLNKINNIINDK